MTEEKKKATPPSEGVIEETIVIEGKMPMPEGIPSIGYLTAEFPWDSLSPRDSFFTKHRAVTVVESFRNWLDIQPASVRPYYRIIAQAQSNGGTRVWRVK